MKNTYNALDIKRSLSPNDDFLVKNEKFILG